jgi:hypothetical protein
VTPRLRADKRIDGKYTKFQPVPIASKSRVSSTVFTGNSPEVIFVHYRELVTPEAAKAWFEV